ncbi:MAG TPA: glycosyltransferase family A protein [Anaerolineales bacterium]|nr:glycosyltransferase family A protein [Anaerolineales bacterium]
MKTHAVRIRPPAAATIGVLNHIPDLGGYFKHQLEVLKLCLRSIREHAETAVDLFVVDNGSCGEVVRYLQSELAAGRIDGLLLNRHNIGKANAVMQILGAAQGEAVFYTDGDIYFKPGWDTAHLAVLEDFPNAGIIGGIPLRNHADDPFSRKSRDWVREHFDGEVETGDLIPAEWTREFLVSVGASGAEMEAYLEEWGALEDCRITRAGRSAYVGASHMQYLISRAAIDRIPARRFESALSEAEDEEIDSAVEAAGLLRLSTDRPYVYHVGNRISEPWLVEEYHRLVGETTELAARPETGSGHWFWGRWRVRRVVRRLSDWLFEKYYLRT